MKTFNRIQKRSSKSSTYNSYMDTKLPWKLIIILCYQTIDFDHADPPLTFFVDDNDIEMVDFLFTFHNGHFVDN